MSLGTGGHCNLTCPHCDTGVDRCTLSALEHAHHIDSPWEVGPTVANSQGSFAPFLQRSLIRIGCHHTICYGFITVGDVRHY